jgi:subtilisin family serine protease
MWKYPIGLGILLAIATTAVWSQDESKGKVKLLVYADRGKKLSAGLRVLRDTQAKLVGVAKGGVMIEVAANKVKEVEQELKKLNARVVRKDLPQPLPVTKLILSYPAGTKVTKADLTKKGLKVVEKHETKTQTVYLVQPTGTFVAAAKTLTEDPNLGHAELNKPIRLPPLTKVSVPKAVLTIKSPNDPLLPKLWGMKNIHAPDAWKKGHDSGKNVIVAVIDSGADLKHEDLKGSLVPGFNFITNSANPQDDHGHGTHVCGTIGAIGNNAKGVVGVTWKVKIMPLKFLDKTGHGSTFNAVKAVDFARRNNARIINNSWGSYGFSQALSDAIGRANTAGILFVCADGNEHLDTDTTPHFPSQYAQPNVVAVVAIDINDKLATFSNFGKKSAHLGAPGVGILSTMLKAGPIHDPSGYGAISGTSMATPHVSGAAALILGRSGHTADKAPALKKALLSHVRKIPALSGKCTTGGTLDIAFLK